MEGVRFLGRAGKVPLRHGHHVLLQSRIGSDRNRLSVTVEYNRNWPQFRNRNRPVSVTGLLGPAYREPARASEDPDMR